MTERRRIPIELEQVYGMRLHEGQVGLEIGEMYEEMTCAVLFFYLVLNHRIRPYWFPDKISFL